MRTRVHRYVLSAAVVLVMLLVGKVAEAQNLKVIPVPWVATKPTLPHYAYNGNPTTFKAIARGGNGTYSYQWDPEGDGTFMPAIITGNRYNLQQVYQYPAVAETTTYQARIRVTSGVETLEAVYPVRIFASTPLTPCVTVPSTGCPAGTPVTSDEDLQIMRNVAIDDALWFMHNQMARVGDEQHATTGAQAYGNVGGQAIPASAGYLWSLGLNGHYAAYNASYVGTLPDAAANTQRFEEDPFAEDAARLINYLLLNAQVIPVLAADESNSVGFPEVAQAPIAGTDDLKGIVWNNNYTYFMGHVLSGLSKANLDGYVAQVGNATEILGRRMEFILQQIIDGVVFGQIDAGTNNEGSWHYNSNGGNDDLSTTLWAATGLWHADEFGGDELIINNRVKGRLTQYIVTNSRPNPANGAQRCGSYETELAGCGHTITAAHMLTLGWIGANTLTPGDGALAFPGYSIATKGTLRAYYDATLAFIAGNFYNVVTPGSLNWNTGIVNDGNFARSDRRINHYGMLHWQDAARAVIPAVDTFGAANWYRHFTDYLMRNQETDGRWDSINGALPGTNTDDYGGFQLTTIWGLLVLQPDAIPPLAIAEATPTSTVEGTSIFFDGSESDPGSAVFTGYTWDFDNGDTLVGETVDYAFPDDGVYTVTLTTGSVGGSTSASVEVTISNAAPAPTAGAIGPFLEGSATSFAALPNDPGTADTHTYAWDFGDGGTGTGQNPAHTYAEDGTYTVTLTVTDDDGAAAAIVPFDVVIGNVAPTPIAASPGPSAESEAVGFTVDPGDPGVGDTHTYLWDFGDGGTSTDPSPTHAYLDEGTGTYTVTVTVTDSDGDFGTATFDHAVANLPPGPTASDDSGPTLEGAVASFSVTPGDPGVLDTHTYAWDFNNDGATDSTDPNPTFVFADEGSYPVNVIVTDNDGGIGVSGVVHVVGNVAPTVSATPPASVLEGTSATFTATGSDAGADTLTYAWSFGDGGTGTGASAAHAYGDNGSYTVTVTVSDGDGGTASDSFLYAVGNAVPAPTAGDTGPSVEGSAASFSAQPNDPGFLDTHTYAWDFGDGSPAGAGASPSHSYADNGTYTVTVTVTDDDGGSASTSFQHVVTNTAPVPTATDPGDSIEGSAVSFTAQANDPGTGDTHTYAWDFGDGSPAGAGQNPSHTYVDDGTYTVVVTVTDNSGASGTASFQHVVTNAAPAPTAGDPGTSAEGDVVSFVSTANDPGTADPHTFLWDFGDGATSTDEDPTHVYADNGTYTVAVTVTDEDGATGAASFEYIISNADPVADAGPAGLQPEGPINFFANPNDPGTGDTHTFAWDFGDGATATDQNPVHTYADEGTYQVVVVVTDDDGGVDTVTFEVVVGNAPPAPVAGPEAPQLEGAPIAFTVSPNDPAPTDTFTFAWDFGDGATSTDQNPTHAYGDNGTYTVTVTVTDDEGAVGTDSFEVVVSNVAPAPTAGPAGNAQEGAPVAFFALPGDAGVLDTHTYAWDFGDGGTSTEQNPSHTFMAVGVYTVTVVVTDDDGGVGTATFDFVVIEATLAITSEPPSHAYEDTLYSFEITYSAGPSDVVTCSLPLARPGMTITGCTVSWPAPQLGQDGPITICVTEDGGTTVCEDGYVWVHIVDTDNDGLSDPWEQEHFGNLDHGATGDADGDGVDNIDEYTGGTDPNVFDGPGQLALESPVCGEPIDHVDPVLVASLGSDPQGHELTYQFQLFRDAAMTELVAESDALDVVVDTSVAWTVPVDLEENTWYHWRARAADHWTAGPWSEACSFFVDVANDAPTAPRINSPAIGAWVGDLTPDLRVDNASDPDDDVLTYAFELYSDAAMTALVDSAVDVVAGAGTTGWTVTVTLAEDATYYWRARATDPAPLAGAWSDTGVFTVNTENMPPDAPVIMAPLDATTIDVLRPALVIRDADDPDLDVLVYDWELATDGTFADVLASGVDDPEEGPVTTSFELSDDLEEDTRYCWRVRSDDGASTSSYATACFLVSALNDPPSVPTLMNPGDDTVVASVAPTFSWAPSTDPEGSTVTYDLEVMNGDGEVVASASAVGGTVTQLAEDLVDGEAYTWRARAVDAEGAASQYSEPNGFGVALPFDEVVDPEVHVSGGGCSAGGGSAGGLALFGLAMVAGLRRRRRR